MLKELLVVDGVVDLVAGLADPIKITQGGDVDSPFVESFPADAQDITEVRTQVRRFNIPDNDVPFAFCHTV